MAGDRPKSIVCFKTCRLRPATGRGYSLWLATSSLPFRPQLLGLLSRRVASRRDSIVVSCRVVSRRVTALQYGCSDDLGPNVSLTGVDFVFGRPRTVGSDVLVIGWTWQACHFSDFVASARNVSDSVAPVRNVQRHQSPSHPSVRQSVWSTI